jgi:sugar phosphate isomerase/epimerase
MKYSFMSFSCTHLTLVELLAEAARHGYDAVEPRIDQNHKHGIELETTAEQRRIIKQTIEESGITLACMATSYHYANPETVQENITNTKRAIELAGQIGAPRVRVFGGELPEGFSRQSAIDLLVDSLGGMVDLAAGHGVTLCVETHDNWCNPHHVAEVMTRVNHPNIAVTWDIMHPFKQENFPIKVAFEILRPWVKHVHIHDSLNREWLPIGEGEINHREAVSVLLSHNYDGYLSGEWINWKEPYSVYLPRELKTMKHYETERI